MEEAELMQSARQADLDAFNELVLKYQNLVFDHAYRLLGNDDVAEDVTQDTFLLAFRKMYQFRGSSFQAWLLKIATNLCYDEMRTWKRAPFLPLEPLNEDGETNDSPYWIKDPGLLPEASIEIRELRDLIERGLGNLPFNFRMVVSLVDLHQLNYKEAALVMGTSIGTVKSRLARGRLMLRNALVRINPPQDLIYQFSKSGGST